MQPASKMGEPQFAIPVPLLRVPLVSAASSQLKQNQLQASIEKRHAAGGAHQSASGLLFKPSAATAGLQRKQSATLATSPRPRQPSAVRQLAASSSQRQRNNYKTASSVSTTPSTTTSSTTTTTITTTMATTKTTTVKPETLVASQRNSPGQMRALELPPQPLRPRHGEQTGRRLSELVLQQQQHQQLQQSSQPDHQRRQTAASVGTNKFTNKPTGAHEAAGPQWSLFNRPDGGLSPFELLALASNLAIVGAIVFVILLTWLKSVKRRRSERSKDLEQLAGPSSGRSSASTNFGAGLGKTPSMSPVRAPSSAAASSLGDLSEPPKATADGQAAKKVPSDENAPPLGRTVNTKALDYSSSATLGSANKAMAIVQPTENSAVDTKSLGTGSLEEKNNKKQASPTVEPDPIEQIRLNRAEAASELVDKLGELASPEAKPGLSSNSNMVGKAASSGHSRSNSLESVELPASLVRSIELTGLRGPASEHVAPSPNLLLSELAGASSVPTTTASSIQKAGQSSTTTTTTTAAGKTKPAEASAKPATESGKPKPAGQTNSILSGQAINEQPGETGQSTLAKTGQATSTSKSDSEQQPKRPENPMGRSGSPGRESTSNRAARQAQPGAPADGEAEGLLKNHQLVVNKLDNRKMQLEIVDIRDESVTKTMRTGDMNSAQSKLAKSKPEPSNEMVSDGWISMDGIAVTQSVAPPGAFGKPAAPSAPGAQQSPSEIIGTRFKVDYGKSTGSSLDGDSAELPAGGGTDSQQQQQQHAEMSLSASKKNRKNDSMEEQATVNNIESELEQDNRLRNRKYFVYIVHDGHFSAKKECIARIELPAKRRITLADLRHLIASSQDHSLTSLRRNRFKFVTETYRLLNEDEDTAVLHHVYPTQGVFLKINIAEATENQVYPGYKSRARLSSSSSNVGAAPSRSATAGAAYRRSHGSTGGGSGSGDTSARSSQQLPEIQVAEYGSQARAQRLQPSRGRTSQRNAAGANNNNRRLGARSKSSLEPRTRQVASGTQSANNIAPANSGRFGAGKGADVTQQRQQQQQSSVLLALQKRPPANKQPQPAVSKDAGLLSGAKKLFGLS